MAIKENQIVTMNFEIKINDDILESNLDAEPIEFTFGSGELLDALETRISDMNEGEEREVNIVAKDAYGEYDERLSETLPIADFEGIDLEIGMVLEADGENGEIFKATVTDVTKEDVTIDYNHPLAGCNLDFTVIIQKIV
ncbi:MAG: peptidylprolyl isomerase [Arcobacter sp.]|nr:MAG: peptidylprolyl isomerase [Arcobacter sp.]